jgi:hypothetical protein
MLHVPGKVIFSGIFHFYIAAVTATNEIMSVCVPNTRTDVHFRVEPDRSLALATGVDSGHLPGHCFGPLNELSYEDIIRYLSHDDSRRICVCKDGPLVVFPL